MSALSSGADYVYSRNAQCCVCMMQMYRDASTLACGHFVCEPCVDALFRNGRSECPVCHADAAIVGEYREAAPQRGSDTNVFEVKLYKLAEDCPIATGEPISCKGCSALLTCYSTVLAQDTLSLWTCEFCGYPNKLTIDQAQIPSSNEVTYVLDPAPEVAAREPQGDATTCIFAIDVSGSMGCGVRVSTPISIKGGKPTNSPTRLDCVMAAVEAQIKGIINNSEFSNLSSKYGK